MQKKVMREDGISTHILRRNSIEVSPNQGEGPQFHPRSMGNEPIFQPALEKKGTVYKINKVQFAR